MQIDLVILLIAFLCLVASITLAFFIYLHRSSKRAAKKLSDIIDDYMQK